MLAASAGGVATCAGIGAGCTTTGGGWTAGAGGTTTGGGWTAGAGCTTSGGGWTAGAGAGTGRAAGATGWATGADAVAGCGSKSAIFWRNASRALAMDAESTGGGATNTGFGVALTAGAGAGTGGAIGGNCCAAGAGTGGWAGGGDDLTAGEGVHWAGGVGRAAGGGVVAGAGFVFGCGAATTGGGVAVAGCDCSSFIFWRMTSRDLAMLSESAGGGATIVGFGAGAGWATAAGAGAGAAFVFGCGAATAGGGVAVAGCVCSSLSFFSNASCNLVCASVSAARSGSRATQYAAAQKTRKDFEICMGAFLRQNGGGRNSFPDRNHFFPCSRPGIKQNGTQHEPADLGAADFNSLLRVEGVAGAQEPERLPAD